MAFRHRPVVAMVGLALAFLASSCAPSVLSPHNPAAYVEGEAYAPAFDAANFSDPVVNDYFPLDPGLTTVFEGGGERVAVTVTSETKVVLGVTTKVITDQVFVDGELREDTVDWYAADNFGNVWYFGEETAEYEGGEITSTEGSWEAGVDGAQPGIIMLADPQVGDAYRQEFFEGHAQDVARVYAVDESITVPNNTFSLVIVTEDWSELDPEVLERKWYAPLAGVVFEETIQGGSGTLSLVDLTRIP
jgi:hypothetical protein